jgi:formiminotetrahydrofolate cyclodeaminase
MKQFLKLSAEELLHEFGAGGHVPGSGSATALTGLLAAQLAYTVVQITLNRPTCSKHHDEVAVIGARLKTTLIPLLTDLVQRDAEAFDVVHQARLARDREQDPIQKKLLITKWLDEQKVATAIPFRIAEVCLELVDHAAILFQIGFKAVRGDSGVALSAAVGSVLSAVYIINLNLIPFKGNYWALQRRKACDALQRAAVDKYKAAVSYANALATENVDALDGDELAEAIEKFMSRIKANYTDAEIDERASELRALVWKHRSTLWPQLGAQTDPVQFLDPVGAFRLLGYDFALSESLGLSRTAAGTFEVAGLLEALPGSVRVSRQMKPEVRLFTAAHELGHVILHPQLLEAHRDRPLDGSVVSRTPIEREADRFASAYLMPTKLVRERFVQNFGTQSFSLSDGTAFALIGTGLVEARVRLKSERGLAKALATAERYNGRQVPPLAAQFKVSATAMAIRLEELDLISFED